MIRPGAFANVLNRGDDIVALWNHDVNTYWDVFLTAP